jgi:hypothetical protein
MRKIELKKKTGFRVNNPMHPVIIRDFRGTLFYSTEPLLPRVKEFNLPAGTYFIDSGYISEMKNPVKYKKVPLPFPERFLPAPTDYDVVFGDNPNKCTIFWNEGVILFDNSFREKPLPQLYFILYHEHGHARYKTEKFADLFAVNCMLDKGFNISQIGSAPVETLSDRADHRKNIVVNQLLKTL